MTDEQARDDEAIVAALAATVRARYGDRLDPEQAGRVPEIIRGLRDAAAALAAYPLVNADEPDPVFAAHRGEE